MIVLALSVLPGTFAICRLSHTAAMPDWAASGDFISITRTRDELSIVCVDHDIPADAKCNRGWRCFKVEGPLDLALTGVLSSLAAPLAEARINFFAISTFDTDYLLVKEQNLTRAVAVLSQAGHAVRSFME